MFDVGQFEHAHEPAAIFVAAFDELAVAPQ